MLFTSPWPDVAIPDLPFSDFLFADVSSWADRPAFIDGPSGRTLSHGQVHALSRQVAGALAQRGLRKGDVFAIVSPNLPEYAVAFHGVAMAGGVVTTASPLASVDELVSQLTDSKARWLLTVPALIDNARAAAGRSQGNARPPEVSLTPSGGGLDAARPWGRSQIEEIFVFGDAAGATSFAELLRSDATLPEIAIDPANDLLCLPYSSGTTGRAKGVMLTHRNAVAMLSQLAPLATDLTGRSAIAVLPFYHAYGMQIQMNGTLHRGTTTVTMPRWDLEQFLALIQQYRITTLILVPPIVLALAKHPRVADFDLSSVEVIGSGAAPLGADLQRAASERVAPVRQGYGMTETSVGVSGWPQDGAGMVDGAVGYLLPNVQARIVDVDSGADLEPGARGELLVRGPNVMRGYLNAREATDAMLDAEGWLHTGDVARFDAQGRLFIVDRLKELIKVKGYQVAPAHLEALLLSHPAVADAAVIGIPDDEAGERPKAFVVQRGEVSAQALIDHVATQVAPYERLRAIEFIEAIPKSPSGKILRRMLRERAALPSAGSKA